MQIITRKGNFDSMHRVLGHKGGCSSIHGHTYLYELKFKFWETDKIGYNIDFKEIKRIGCQWIEDNLDHAAILNPVDNRLISACVDVDSKFWIMSLNIAEGEPSFCNPSAENIAREIFLAMDILFKKFKGLVIHEIVLWETPNCYTVCTSDSPSLQDRKNFMAIRGEAIKKYAQEKGIEQYDSTVTE